MREKGFAGSDRCKIGNAAQHSPRNMQVGLLVHYLKNKRETGARHLALGELDLRIDDDHMYHGAALIQIAEDTHFTAINTLHFKGTSCKVAYKINDKIAVYLKYASRPLKNTNEYPFSFTTQQIRELKGIAKVNENLFLALVCVEEREICGIPYSRLLDLIARRREAKGSSESQYTLLVTVEPGKSLRLYVNEPKRRGCILGKPLIVSRNAFPKILFR